MSERHSGGLQQAARALAVVSVLTTLSAGVAAGLTAARDSSDGSGTLVRGSGDPGPTSETPEAPSFDYAGWKVVNGMPGDSGDAATYRVPATGWKTFAADYKVSFKNKFDVAFAKGHALANYTGNKCVDDDAPVPGGWTVLADTQPSGDLETITEKAVRRWARGYATNARGTTAKMSTPVAQTVTVDDGTTAARASIDIDMSIFTGVCLPDRAEIMVTTIDTPDGAKSLVQARYLDAKGITDEQWEGISQSLAR